jgi:hypothetical protein
MSGLIGTLIGIILLLVVLGVIWWAVQQLLPLIPLAEPFHTIIRVLMTVILVLVVLWVILILLGAAGVHVPGPFRLGSLTGSAFAALSTRSSLYL